MPERTQQQMSFGGGVNAQTPPHLLAMDQVQTATNVDFSLWRGAAAPRRGYGTYITTTFTHRNIFKSYRSDSTEEWSMYSFHMDGAAFGVGRATASGGGTGAYTSITSAGGAPAGYCRFGSYTYIAAGPNYVKDDGTLTTDWIKQVPSAPTVTLNTTTGIVITSGNIPASEGSLTFAAGGTATYTCNPANNRVSVVVATAINLATCSTFVTDTVGVFFTQIGFSDPSQIYRVSLDFAVDAVTIGATTTVSTLTTTTGTTTTTTTLTATAAVLSTGFLNYFHAEYLPNNGTFIDSALATPNALTGGVQTVAGSNAVSSSIIASIQSLINTDLTTPITQVTFNGNVLSMLAIPKTNFQLVGTYTNTGDPWANVKGFRCTVESFVPSQSLLLGTVSLIGDEGHCLTDMNQGYLWYQTYAQIGTDGNFIGESAPSPTITAIKCQNANASVVTNGTATGSHGITHIITYRQGGYMQAPYAVSTQSYAVKTFTDTLSDIQALLQDTPMVMNVYSHSNFPGDVFVTAPEPWYEQLFVANGGTLMWSTPGRPDQFPINNFAVVSDIGDLIQGLSVWVTGLVIVNQQSVYEMNGSDFSGPNANFVIQKSGARKGSIAKNTIIKTPYGIPLVNYDGISMYQPGAGYEKTLPWVTEQIGDAFRGFLGFDPAGLNNSRVPAINGNIFQATAAFNEGKLYLAAATGTNTFNDTVYVIDFETQKCWWYQYQIVNSGGASFYALYWDFANNKMYAGGKNGIYLIENFVTEPTITGSGTGTALSTGGVQWNFLTRAWTAPTDSLVENLNIEFIGGPIQVTAIYDGTSTSTLGTIASNGSKTYASLPLSATIENNLVFGFSSVASTATSQAVFTPTAVYGITWDSYPHPSKDTFYQTDYDNNNYEGDKLWDVEFFDIGFLQSNANTGTLGTHTGTDGTGTVTGSPNAIGTVTAVTFIDGVAVMTHVMTGTGAASQGRRVYDFSFPSETYGEVAHTVLTAPSVNGTQQVFKLWNHNYQARNEPPKVTYWHTDWQSLEENICDGWDTDINPNGTVLGTAFIDNIAITTGTYTGTKRQSFTTNFPVEKYGRTLYVEYTNASTSFKHYKTWFHLREEPDRWTSYVSDRRSTVEQHFDNFECELNCLGVTVLATAFIDNTAISTFTYTSTGSTQRERFVSAFPAETYGKTVYTQYTSTGKFKFFRDHFNGTPEPDRVNFLQKILQPWPSEQYAKTWITEINPLGTTVGTLYIEGFPVVTGTFTGTIREIFNIGIDNPAVVALQTATAIEARYGDVTGTGLFKHYKTDIETEAKPFGKTSWAISFRKIGGASQIDVARYHTLDVEVPPSGTATVTTIWDIDQQIGFSTNTFTFAAGRNYLDLVPFPPGGRGRLFQERVISSIPIKVWRSILYEERVGVKGFTTTSLVGTPSHNG